MIAVDCKQKLGSGAQKFIEEHLKTSDTKAKLVGGEEKFVASRIKFFEEHRKLAEGKQLLVERKTKIGGGSKQLFAERNGKTKTAFQQGLKLQRKASNSKDSSFEDIDPDYDLPVGRNTEMEVKVNDWEWYDLVDDEYNGKIVSRRKRFKLESKRAIVCCKDVKVIPVKKVGASSLQEYVMQSILDHIGELTVEAIEWLPRHLALEAFNLIMGRGIMTFALWKCFQSVLQGGRIKSMSQLYYRQSILEPKISLSDYTKVLSSPNMDHLVYLSITARFSTNAYVRLADLKNLGILEIVRVDPDRSSAKSISDARFKDYEPEPPNLDDRVVRAWSEMVVSDGAFPVLRILKLWYHKYITNLSIEYVATFPSLAIFDVCGCGCAMDIKECGEHRHGWLSTYKVDHLSFLEEACVKRLRLLKVARDSSRQKKGGPGLSSELSGIPAGDEGDAHNTPDGDIKRTSPYLIAIDSPVRVLPRKDVAAMQINNTVRYQPKRQAVSTWDYQDFTAFAKIGELRRDKDLQKQGWKISNDQTFVADQLISPVPMACLRLGPNIDHLYPCADEPMNAFFELAASNNSSSSDSNGNGPVTDIRIRPQIFPSTFNDLVLFEQQIFNYTMSFYRIKMPQDAPQPPSPGQTIKRKAEKAQMKVKKPKIPNQFDFMP